MAVLQRRGELGWGRGCPLQSGSEQGSPDPGFPAVSKPQAPRDVFQGHSSTATSTDASQMPEGLAFMVPRYRATYGLLNAWGLGQHCHFHTLVPKCPFLSCVHSSSGQERKAFLDPAFSLIQPFKPTGKSGHANLKHISCPTASHCPLLEPHPAIAHAPEHNVFPLPDLPYWFHLLIETTTIVPLLWSNSPAASHQPPSPVHRASPLASLTLVPLSLDSGHTGLSLPCAHASSFPPQGLFS